MGLVAAANQPSQASSTYDGNTTFFGSTQQMQWWSCGTQRKERTKLLGRDARVSFCRSQRSLCVLMGRQVWKVRRALLVPQSWTIYGRMLVSSAVLSA